MLKEKYDQELQNYNQLLEQINLAKNNMINMEKELMRISGKLQAIKEIADMVDEYDLKKEGNKEEIE